MTHISFRTFTLVRALLAWTVSLCASLALAQNAVVAITGSRDGGQEQVRIDFANALTALPKTFATQNPARIALDFPGVGSAMGMGRVALAQVLVDSALVAQSDERSRVVLNLRRPANYRLALADKSLLITLESIVSEETPLVRAPVSGSADLAARAPSEPLSNIEFQRSSDGAGRIIVSLPNSSVAADIKAIGTNLVVDFSNVSLPERLRKRLEVIDFATPVQTISTSTVGDRVRMLISPQGAWEHTAYQTDRQLVIDIKAYKPDTKKLSQGEGFNGEKLSLNFQNIDVRQVLQVIADFTKFNVVTSDSVTGSVTLRVQNVPWDQVLEIILRSKGLAVRKNGNVLWVAPKEEIAAKEKADYESQASSESLEPLRTQSFQLNYAKASDIAPQLTAGGGAASPAPTAGGASAGAAPGGRLLSNRGSAIAEPRTNQLFVTDIASKLDQVRQMLEKIDVPVRQVLIEARIVEATNDFGKSLGVKLGGVDMRAQQGGNGGYSIGGENRVAFGTSYANAVSSSTGGTVDTSGSFVNMPAVGQGGFAPASLAMTIFSAASNRLMALEISALESDGTGKVISSPRITSFDKVKSLIEQGTEVPYQMATSSGATAVSFRKAVLKLEVTPQITPDGNISLEVDVSKDSVGSVTAAGPTINTKHIQTKVLVENGGTVVIGGIYEQNDTQNVTQVPFFGDLPVVGALFKNRSTLVKKTELLVFLTPKLISEATAAR
ncbi:MAG: type IV pilus secretin PilQ [Betaproteobacteria bacterium]